MLCCILAYKIPSHNTAYKYAVTGGLKEFSHFRRGNLTSSLLLFNTKPSMTMMYRHCNSGHDNVFYQIFQFSLDVNSLTSLGRVHILLPSIISNYPLRTFPREYFNEML